jgi:hypothetical protein
MHTAHAGRSGEAVETGSLFLLTIGCGCCHCFGRADEVVCGLKVEEVEVLEVVVFGAFEDIERYAESFACFVYGVEEVEEDLIGMSAVFSGL